MGGGGDHSVHNRIAEKVKDAFFRHYRFTPPPSEVNSWRNSLRAVSQVIEDAKLRDLSVPLEYGNDSHCFADWKPIRFVDLGDGVISSRIASNTTRNWESYFFSRTASFVASSTFA